jgi:hypothetical protein
MAIAPENAPTADRLPASPFAGATVDLHTLRDSFAGEIHGPGDPDWDRARIAWNLAVDQQPAAVAIPAGHDDVVLAVEFARANGLRVAAQGTGHNAAAFESLDGTLLVKTEAMRDVSIDADARRARVGAGVIWGEVVGPAVEQGLLPLSGSSHDVGVVGYTLGGGVSFLARKHGLAADHVTAIEIVTPDAEHRTVTADSDPDLFWALRGGGGNFGIVTALEFELLAIADLFAGALFFPYERSGEVLEAWRRWSADLPEEATSVGRMIQFPPIPEIPEPFRGNSYAIVEMVYLGGEDRGAELIAPLRELGPELDTFAMIDGNALLGLHMDPPQPVPGIGDHQMLADLDADSLAALVAAVGPGTGSPILSFEFRLLGGALARRAEGSGALGALEGRYMTFGVGMLPAPALAPPLRESLARAREALDPVDNGANYLNFAERPVEPDSMFGARTLARLREIRERIDPDGLMHANHGI